ncbi:MAG: DUF4976 domain-containing protein, partial [Verrucomicrobiaceae bacterium]
TAAHYGVRTETHKLIHYWEKETYEMFDLTKDPTEQHNLLSNNGEAGPPEVSRVFGELKAELVRLQEHYKDDGRYAAPADRPKGTAEPTGERKALGVRTVVQAMEDAGH